MQIKTNPKLFHDCWNICENNYGAYFVSFCSEFVEVDVSLIDSFEELWLVDLLGDLELEEGLSRWRDGDRELFLTILTFSFWGVGFWASSTCSIFGLWVPVPRCLANYNENYFQWNFMAFTNLFDDIFRGGIILDPLFKCFINWPVHYITTISELSPG